MDKYAKKIVVGILVVLLLVVGAKLVKTSDELKALQVYEWECQSMLDERRRVSHQSYDEMRDLLEDAHRIMEAQTNLLLLFELRASEAPAATKQEKYLRLLDRELLAMEEQGRSTMPILDFFAPVMKEAMMNGVPKREIDARLRELERLVEKGLDPETLDVVRVYLEIVGPPA